MRNIRLLQLIAATLLLLTGVLTPASIASASPDAPQFTISSLDESFTTSTGSSSHAASSKTKVSLKVTCDHHQIGKIPVTGVTYRLKANKTIKVNLEFIFDGEVGAKGVGGKISNLKLTKNKLRILRRTVSIPNPTPGTMYLTEVNIWPAGKKRPKKPLTFATCGRIHYGPQE